jgi:hypothetical protein
LKQEGKCLGGHPLQNQGKVLSGPNGRHVADGPFAEIQGSRGGYFYLQVVDENEALDDRSAMPRYFNTAPIVEGAPVAEMCSVRERALASAAPSSNGNAVTSVTTTANDCAKISGWPITCFVTRRASMIRS